MKLIVIGAVLVSVAIGLAFQLFSAKEPSVDATSSEPAIFEQSTSIEETASPFAVNDKADASAPSTPDQTASAVSSQRDVQTPDDALIPSWNDLLNEEQLGILVRRLKADPALLQQLVDEFRQETDPKRKALLASVLGEVGGDQVTLLASELIFSGNEADRTLGLNLLQEVQPGNPQARDIVSGMLATEVKPDVLIGTLTALAKPGDVDDSSRAYLADQVAWLTSHEDVSVRGISLDILSRWSSDGRYADVFVAALDDESANVRSSAAYSLVGQDIQSPAVVERLFATLEAAQELVSVKRAAVLALKSMSLSQTQQARLAELEQSLNTVIR